MAEEMNNISTTLLPLDHKFYKNFHDSTAFYLTGPHQYLLPKYTPKILAALQNFKARDDDIYVATFPKTGTSWMQEIVYLIMNDVDCEKARNTIRESVFPYLEFNSMELPPKFTVNLLEVIENLPSPRLIKSHLPYCLLPPDAVAKKNKFIYVSRNIKDTIISYYQFCLGTNFFNFQGELDEFAQLFLEDRVPFAPYVLHIQEYWERRNDSNVFFTTYEDLKKNQEPVIEAVGKFLNKTLTPKQVRTIANHCDFDVMKNNPAANKECWTESGFLANKDFKFMRKGVVGDWKNHMSPELIQKCDDWIRKQITDSELQTILI